MDTQTADSENSLNPSFGHRCAGVVIYGRDGYGNPEAVGSRREKTFLLSSFSVGRFANNTSKYYSPCKGSIDPGEDVLTAADRELAEETGIALKTLMGEAAFARLEAGEELHDLPVAGYPGVRVLSARKVEQPHLSVHYHGNRSEDHYYAIELEGIRQLRPYLKQPGQPSDANSPKVKHTAGYLANRDQTFSPLREAGRSQFEWLFAAMRDGAAGGKKPLLNRLTDAEYRKTTGDSFFASLQEAAKKDPQFAKVWENLQANRWFRTKNAIIPAQEDWIYFVRHAPAPVYRVLRDQMQKVKKYLAQQGLVGDHTGFKLDTSINYLSLVCEGAEILPVTDFVARTVDCATLDRDAPGSAKLYARSMFGQYDGDKLATAFQGVDTTNRTDFIKRSQIWPVMQVMNQVAPEEFGRSPQQ